MIWDQLPEPDPPLIVDINGGFVHAREDDKRKAAWFEVIVGKSIPEAGDTKRFAFVSKYDEKPKRRLYATLKTQGLAMHQEITYLSDGGDTVRNLQAQISPLTYNCRCRGENEVEQAEIPTQTRSTPYIYRLG